MEKGDEETPPEGLLEKGLKQAAEVKEHLNGYFKMKTDLSVSHKSCSIWEKQSNVRYVLEHLLTEQRGRIPRGNQ